jgi:hypothetical protein
LLFPSLDSFISDSKLKIDGEVKNVIILHMLGGLQTFTECFPHETENSDWFVGCFE